MRSIISKGKTVEDALNVGLKLLNTSINNVNIRIIQPGKRSILWFRSKKAEVELMIKEEIKELQVIKAHNINEKKCDDNDLLEKTEATKFDLEGKVWVKDGKLYAQPTAKIIPIVTLENGIKLFKGEEMMEGENIPLIKSGEYSFRIETETIETTWNIKIDKNKLNVSLKVNPGYKIIRSISDYEPDSTLKIKLNEKKQIVNSLEYKAIIKKLEELKVSYGIQQPEIIKAMETMEPGEFEIALGIMAQEGKHGWVENKVKTEVEKGFKEMENGQVDYREIATFPTVEKGAIIAVIHPAIPGKMGITVTNEPLPAKQTFPIIPNLSNEVIIVDDKVIAMEDGRPSIEVKGQLVKISIWKKLTQEGNVSLKTGNIRFKGDVEIKGDVEEKMEVEAGGNIFVKQAVHQSSLQANGSIISKGSINNSKLIAGENHLIFNELSILLQQISTTIDSIVVLLDQVISAPNFNKEKYNKRGLESLVRRLIENRYGHFPVLVKKYVQMTKSDEYFHVPSSYIGIAESLSKVFLSLSPTFVGIDNMMDLAENIKELPVINENKDMESAFINVPSVFNSYLNYSGNVTVYGQGSINTRIYAAGEIKILGVLRGGKIYAKEGANINEAGTNSGIATSIIVPVNQKIIIKKVLEGTTIVIGNTRYTFKEDKYHVYASLNKNEKIVITQT
ncbi:flagellar assembly protein A [Niallia sp. 03133]|uniref:flagellar assembly protein A n=1 Tax=Niallia sp. 03133 TaxID=3458060 RepID=UPI004044EFCC